MKDITRKTKIICTLGPATDDPQVLEKMILAGLDVARFNFSHGAYEDHEKRLEELVELRNKLNMPIATLLDTKGPEIRLGDFENPNGVEIKDGDKFVLTTKECLGTKERCFVNYDGLTGDVKKGTTILINDGLISMTVDKVKGSDIHCTVVDGGLLTNHKGVNVPGVELKMPYLSARDMADLQFGKEHDFDFIAASFVRNATDITILRNYTDAIGWKNVKIIAKIENSQGVDNIDDIIAASDGIMVARGDMGVEIHFELIPSIQKMIIQKVYKAGKIVVTATQMLESMITNPRPTRAEITDVANAIYDGTSAIMLSGESAVGKHPVEAVEAMASIARTTEQDIDYVSRFNKFYPESGAKDITSAISHATVTTSHDLNASAIITVTKSGTTARMISKFRPYTSIVGATIDDKVWRQLNLSWGVTPVKCEVKNNTDELFDHAVEVTYKAGLIQKGETVVITAGIPLGISGTTNMLKVQEVNV
ncbi:MAG TPA: pyruvate kinase [Candidatus Eubacterium faecigallinarum]|nr:pyruvate kinase [Candidatus Eubacterium faecigallinarum]